MSALGRGGHHGGGHGGGGFRRGGGGGYFAPSYGYPVIYDEPDYVPIFIVEDDEDRARKAANAAKEAAKAKGAASGLGILAPSRHRRTNRRTMLQGLGMTFGGSAADPAVTEVQNYLNTILASRGYNMIGVDGKLGKGTCGAVAWLMQGGASDINTGVDFDLNSVPQSVWAAWNICASSAQVAPTPKTATAKTSSYNVAVTQNAAAPINPQAVMDAQSALNVALKAAGMCAIGVDGKGGPETCGAQTWLIANAGGDGLTQAQRDAISLKCSTSNKTTPASCPAQAIGPAPTPSTLPPAPIVVAPKKISTASMVAGVGIAAAVVALGYAYFKHKSGG